MKKNHIIILLALWLLSGQIFAQPSIESGSFQFQFQNSRDKSIENITLDGIQRIDERQNPNILIINLFPGEYSLTVQYRFHNVLQTAYEKINIEPRKRIICTLNESNRLSFNYTIDNSSMPLVYDPKIIGTVMGAFGTMVNGVWQMSQSDVHIHHDHHNDHHDGHHNDHHNPPHQGNHNPQVAPPPAAITQSDFNNLYNSVKKESFEDDKLQTIKTSSNFYPYFTSDQVRQLAGLLSFDDNKLDAVKYLAPKVTDRQNLPLLKDVFKSSFTREDYLNFLNTLR